MSSSQVSSSSHHPTPGPSSPGPASLEQRGSALNASSAAERKARREQLRAFYGIKGGAGGDAVEEEAEGTGGGAVGRTARVAGSKGERADGADELDIDSPGFNPAAYCEDLVAKASLADLMKRASSLSADVGNLQSSRHSLVYHHHHQLFSAGDTIAVLNTRTPQLISIVNALQDSFSSISQLVDAVALPAEPENRAKEGEQPDDGDDRALRQDLQRLKLMVVAEEQPEKISQLWECVKPRIEGKMRQAPDQWSAPAKEVEAVMQGWAQTQEEAKIAE